MSRRSRQRTECQREISSRLGGIHVIEIKKRRKDSVEVDGGLGTRSCVMKQDNQEESDT